VNIAICNAPQPAPAADFLRLSRGKASKHAGLAQAEVLKGGGIVGLPQFRSIWIEVDQEGTEVTKRSKAAGKQLENVGSDYATVREAAERARSSEPTIRRLLSKGDLTRFKFGGKTLISISELDSLVKRAS
jgi:excisionase family DNA binding protein